MKFIFCKPPCVEFFFLFMSEIEVPGKQSWHVTMAVYDVTTSSAVILDSLKLFLDVNASLDKNVVLFRGPQCESSTVREVIFRLS